jgi:hypothetical protein
MTTSKSEVETLVKKAETAEKSEDALRYSQAALNAAHAFQVLAQTAKTA